MYIWTERECSINIGPETLETEWISEITENLVWAWRFCDSCSSNNSQFKYLKFGEFWFIPKY